MDIFNGLLLTLDLDLSSIRSKVNRKKKGFSKEAVLKRLTAKRKEPRPRMIKMIKVLLLLLFVKNSQSYFFCLINTFKLGASC